MEYRQLIIIGGGPAGLAAALGARKEGVEDILILERDSRPGGILNQCIHNGFGLHTFREELTGPEYAERYVNMAEEAGIPIKLNTIAVDISPRREVTYVNEAEGVVTVGAGAVILAMGCRERPRGALGIPGSRPAGVYTAGTAQRLMNIEGRKIGKSVVVLGSGDIGLIMARRLTLEGAEVKLVAELMPYSGGLRRNIVQCLDDYGIPLLLSHTVTRIHGRERVEGVTVSQVGPDRSPVPGTEGFCPCDTLLLSCGLLPENELSKSAGIVLSRVTGGPVVTEGLETGVPGVFACGNVLHVHDLVDYVSEEAAMAGTSAAKYLQDGAGAGGAHAEVKTAGGIRYTVPQRISPERMGERVKLRFRVGDVLRDRTLCVYYGEKCVKRIKKRVMSPGEMEEVTLTRESFRDFPGLREILITTEEA